MTVEYGYLGAVDVTTVTTTPNGVSRAPVLQADGEPVYAPAAPSSWAKELQSDDGAWRFLKGGNAQGRGVGNVFDATLADNFTVLCLVRLQKPSYGTFVGKGSIGSTVGWWVQPQPQQASWGGLQSRIDPTIGANTGKANHFQPKDQQWHWYGLSLSGLNVYSWLNGGARKSEIRSAGDLTNTGNLLLSVFNAGLQAATLIYNRVLTDTEVSNIMSGKAMPKDVSGLVGYYKFNETHGSAGGQCTDYSGQGNHLTYSGAVWETFVPTSTAKTNFASGQPYVTPTLRNPLNWWERTPPAIADPERMGCLYNSNASVPTSATLDTVGMQDTMSISLWLRPVLRRSLLDNVFGRLKTSSPWGAAPFRLALQPSGTVEWNRGNGDTNTSVSWSAGELGRPVADGVWVHIALVQAGNQCTLYLNGVKQSTKTIGAYTLGTVGTAMPLNMWSVALGRLMMSRSRRVFHRAITAAEVEELFLTDRITNRAELLGEWVQNEVQGGVCGNTGNLGSVLNSGSEPAENRQLTSPYAVPRRKRFGKQLRFDSTKQAITSQSLNLTLSTVSAWVKWYGWNDGANRGTVVGQAAGGLQLRVNANGSLQLIASNVVSITTSAPGVVKGGAWCCVSADYDGTTGNLYVDGKLVKSATEVRSLSPLPVAIGARAGVEYYRGTIDDLRIYNRALTAAEHYALYLDQAPRNGLVAEYTFDNDATNCQDTSGNGYHATWTGIGLSNYVQEM